VEVVKQNILAFGYGRISNRGKDKLRTAFTWVAKSWFRRLPLEVGGKRALAIYKSIIKIQNAQLCDGVMEPAHFDSYFLMRSIGQASPKWVKETPQDDGCRQTLGRSPYKVELNPYRPKRIIKSGHGKVGFQGATQRKSTLINSGRELMLARTEPLMGREDAHRKRKPRHTTCCPLSPKIPKQKPSREQTEGERAATAASQPSKIRKRAEIRDYTKTVTQLHCFGSCRRENRKFHEDMDI
jgi:hypothetical protein